MEIYKKYDAKLTLYPNGIEAVKEYENLALPNPTSDQVGKYLQLVSSTDMYGDPAYAVEFHTPVPDIDQIRMTANMAAFQCMQLSSSLENLSYSVQNIRQSVNTISTSVYSLYNYAVRIAGNKTFTGNIYAGNTTVGIGSLTSHFTSAYINNLYGSDNISKPVSQIALVGDLSSLATEAALESMASALYASLSSCITSSVLSSYATQSWVLSQGYASMGDIPSLSGYATESWVSSNFLNVNTYIPEVYGTSDGDNWTSLTIDGDTYGFATGGATEINTNAITNMIQAVMGSLSASGYSYDSSVYTYQFDVLPSASTPVVIDEDPLCDFFEEIRQEGEVDVNKKVIILPTDEMRAPVILTNFHIAKDPRGNVPYAVDCHIHYEQAFGFRIQGVIEGALRYYYYPNNSQNPIIYLKVKYGVLTLEYHIELM